jgi:hypothetical protein
MKRETGVNGKEKRLPEADQGNKSIRAKEGLYWS